jgi:hypothetical protein
MFAETDPGETAIPLTIPNALSPASSSVPHILKPIILTPDRSLPDYSPFNSTAGVEVPRPTTPSRLTRIDDLAEDQSFPTTPPRSRTRTSDALPPWQSRSPGLTSTGDPGTPYPAASVVDMSPRSYHSVPSSVHFLLSPGRASLGFGSPHPPTMSPIPEAPAREFLVHPTPILRSKAVGWTPSTTPASTVEAGARWNSTASSAGTNMPTLSASQVGIPVYDAPANKLAKGYMPDVPPTVHHMLVAVTSKSYNM